MINCRTIRQTAEIIAMDGVGSEVIRTGDRALVRFRFIHAPEFMKKGMRFVFRDGQAKGIGKIVRIVPEAEIIAAATNVNTNTTTINTTISLPTAAAAGGGGGGER
jgi:hypothetical protein